jgi:hypothetical protein
MLPLLMWLVCTTVGCAKESGAFRLAEALDQESNRLSLLSEDSGTVELAPSTDSYWVALVPSDESSNLSPDLPLTRRDYESVCSDVGPGARILVGDTSGVGCVTTSALDTAELRIVSKMPGESVTIQLFHDNNAVRVVAMN